MTAVALASLHPFASDRRRRGTIAPTMRAPRWLLVLALSTGCGFEIGASAIDAGPGGDHDAGSDAPPDVYVEPPPRLIPGGGVADAPVLGAVHVHVVDALTRQPIEGASVDVGGIAGTTDATGLFTARDPGLLGRQTVLATRAGYRPTMWVGAAGANVTISLAPTAPVVPSASIAGTIQGFEMPPPPPGHYYGGYVLYSQSDLAFGAENQLPTAGNTHRCNIPSCTFVVTTRTGNVALLAGVYDINTNNTGTPNDDVATLATYAYRTGLVVENGVSQAGVVLRKLAPGELTTLSVAFGTPPAGLGEAFAYLGVELPTDGVAYLHAIPTLAEPTGLAPKLSVFPEATYRLVAVASTGQEGGATSTVIRRGNASTSLDAGAWLPPPTGVQASRTEIRYAAVSGAVFHTVELRQGATSLLTILVLDDTTTIAIPASLALPGGALTGTVGALRGTLDVTSFGMDADGATLDATATAPVVTIN